MITEETINIEKPILYGSCSSSSTRRVRILLSWKNIDYELKLINLKFKEQKSEEYLKINPSGRIPAYITKNGKVISQSEAITEYIEETNPERPLLPKNTFQRAQIRSIVQLIACDIQPLQNTGLLDFAIGELDEQKDKEKWANHWITVGFEGLEKIIKQCSGTYSVGDQVTMADVFLCPMVYNAYRWNVDMSVFPTITRIYNTLLTLPEFKNTEPPPLLT
ncbi:unnamed protein product [Cunninghamella blakesleeana]